MDHTNGVRIPNLSFSYTGGFHLSLENLEIKPGEVTAILGPNGSGKSTLFGLIRGRLEPTKGAIFINNRDISAVSDRHRASLVGLVPQLNESPYDFSVEDVVKMGAYRFGSAFCHFDQSLEQTLDAALDQCDLLSFRHRHVDSLSGGEYQRVLLARVLLQNPDVLLLDEPANHLDLRHQDTLLELLRRQAENGKTVITILHDVNQALLHTDKVLLMKNGRCVVQGPVQEVISPERIRQVYNAEMDYYYPSWEEGAPILGPGKGLNPLKGAPDV